MMRFEQFLCLLSIVTGTAFAQKSVSVKPLQSTSSIAVGAQYDTQHVYVAPKDLDKFIASFLGTFGGQSTTQSTATLTPVPSTSTTQLLQTPVGTVSVFGYSTPIPAPFGVERDGYLVSDMGKALKAARDSGADVLVEPYPDPVGLDAVIQWPGGVYMQIYTHTTPPSYASYEHVPENRVYVSGDRIDAFLHSFLLFSQGKIISDVRTAPGIEIGQTAETYRRVRIESNFGKLSVQVTDGHLPYPFGKETTGYQVDDLTGTLSKAKALGAVVLVEPFAAEARTESIVQFPGGYIAEIHSSLPKR